MNLFGRKMRFVLLVSGAAIIMLILTWRFVQGGATSIQEGFVPVNAQMQELLDRQPEEADAKADKSSKSGIRAGGSKDTKNTMNAQGVKDAKEVKDAKGAQEAKDPMVPKSAQDTKQTKGGKDSKNQVDPKNATDAQETKDTKDTKDTRNSQSVNGANGTGGANESVDLKIQESQASDGKVNGSATPSLEHPATETTNKLNINTATWEQLDKLPGIGESKAKAIIAYRDEKGYFHKVEDLVQVKGIGDKMLDKLRKYIYANTP